MRFTGRAMVENPSANAGDGRDMGWSLSQKDLLKEEMATHFCISARKSQAQRVLVGHGPWGGKPNGVHTYMLFPYTCDKKKSAK